jgi:hypothetical protein
MTSGWRGCRSSCAGPAAGQQLAGGTERVRSGHPAVIESEDGVERRRQLLVRRLERSDTAAVALSAPSVDRKSGDAEER